MFAYMEDFDLGLRIRAAGWRVAGAPGAVGVHLGSATHGHRSARQRRHGGFSRGYLLRRYGVLRGRAAVRALLTEAVVSLGDLVVSRDLGRAARPSWRVARGGRASASDAAAGGAIDAGIGFRASLALRLGVYGAGARHERRTGWCPARFAAPLPEPTIQAPDRLHGTGGTHQVAGAGSAAPG